MIRLSIKPLCSQWLRFLSVPLCILLLLPGCGQSTMVRQPPSSETGVQQTYPQPSAQTILPIGTESPPQERVFTSSPSSESSVEHLATPLTHPSFLSALELQQVLASGKRGRQNTSFQGQAASAVLPHHLLAAPLLVPAMEALARQKPTLVILVGPNHSNLGAKVLTGASGWKTPSGVVEADRQVVQALWELGLAGRGEEILAKEHSVGALMPLLQHYMPQAKVVPLILHHDVSLKEVDDLLAGLRPFLGEDTLLIASVDFSHYLTRSEAQGKDQLTLQLMREHNLTRLFQLDNDYLDSPASLAAAFRLAQEQGIKDFHLLGNTNTGVLLNNDWIETTSYFTLVFAKKE